MNTFAIGIPDKVGRAERDRNSEIARLHESVVKRKTKVIEFDLPKRYANRNAYHTARWWVDLSYKIPNFILRIREEDSENHFGKDCFNGMNARDRANFYLLLAAANGHKLE